MQYSPMKKQAFTGFIVSMTSFLVSTTNKIEPNIFHLKLATAKISVLSNDLETYYGQELKERL